jgi:8-oxo-dGTP pyrophosphatase MutT (NUDIX family)
MLMAPPVRQHKPNPHDHPRESAVLALLHTAPLGTSLVFTLRPSSLKHHGGQISFPGGRMEPQDRTCIETALRETREELGIATDEIEILGELSPLFIAPSQNLVHPLVGWTEQLPPLVPSPAEVAEVLVVPLRRLLAPETRDDFDYRRADQLLTAPCYRVPGGCIWGATAMMLSELLTLVATLIA